MVDNQTEEKQESGKRPAPPVPLLELPIPPSEPSCSKKSSRSSSPVGLPAELNFKAQTQMGRLAMHMEALGFLPDTADGYTMEELNTQIVQVEELHRAFLKEHTYFEMTWPVALKDHEYFRESVHLKACRAYSSFKRAAAKLRASLTSRVNERPPTPTEDTQSHTRLPNIKLPKFGGDYSHWPPFAEIFKSLILDNAALKDVERLHYLRGCLEGEPAQLISTFALTGASLEPSWKVLTARYENRRLHIQSHLDTMFSITPMTQKSAAGIYNLITTVSKAHTALRSLGVDDQMWECILVHHISRNLDRSTREAWETSLGALQDYPTFSQLDNFLTARARALERVESSCNPTSNSSKPAAKPASKKSASAHQASANSSSSSTQSGTNSSGAGNRYPCDCCNGDHFIVVCDKFRQLNAGERRQVAIEKHLCFNCLGRHNARLCRSRQGCKECSGRHHTMLHDPSSTQSSAQQQKPSSPANSTTITETAASTTSNKQSHSTLLATALAHTHTSVATHQVRLLVDSGSELTFASEQLIRLLNIQRQHSSIPIIGIGGTRSTQTRGIAQLTLKSTHSSHSITVQAHILRTVTSILPSFEAPPQDWPHLEKLKLADSEFLKPRPIDIIIGADHYGQIIKPNIIKGTASMPVAQLSIFGWLVLGPVHTAHSATLTARTATVQQESTILQELLTKFWVQEELPTDTPEQLTLEEQECETHFRTTNTRDSTGRYIVRIPMKMPAALLGDSYGTAQRCLKQMLKRHSRDNDFRELYQKFMQEYEGLGHMVKAQHTSRDGKTQYYLPHHGVVRPDSTTTKLRVVFNGSSATSSGHSLNDLMHTGAKLQLDIPDVLIWIRLHRHLFATDITKMFRQIKVHPDDWDLQRILWIDEQLNETPYQLTTVTYGTKAAPFLAVRTLLQLAEDEGHRFPLALPPLQLGRYVDDIYGGADSLDQLIEIAQQLKTLCHAGGFPLAKWHSTQKELLTAISSASTPDSSISLDDCSTKILGINWLPQEDQFVFISKLTSQPAKLTKRLILSEVAQIFDPLGFISPVTIRSKMLLQELWLHKLNWDDSLPPSITTRWLGLREDLKCLARLSLPRWLNTRSGSSVELHGFSDASQLAMSAVVYIVVRSPSTVAQATLVCSKTKVAPLKRLTIPRLELTAALLLAKLTKYVQATLKLDIGATHLWTDSQVTLMWIKSHASRWKDYVRNRVTQIQELTPEAQWRHVPGTSNPADCASRGVTTAQLKDHNLWWTGPPWITQPKDSWPAQPVVSGDLEVHETRPGISLIAAAQRAEYHWDLIYKISSLHKLFRLTALCFRISRKLKRTLNSPVLVIPSDDMEAARRFWILATQAAYFSSELTTLRSGSTLPRNHPFTRLTAFVDEQGIIRVGGRLSQSTLTQEGRHPAILPRTARLSLMIIDNAHQRTFHGGTQLTLAQTRQSYWILGGRAPVKTHILRCVVCARQRGIRAHQLMGQLPLSRVTPSRPFLHTGVDYAGPLTLKTWKGRGAKTYKGWICVFVCFSTSAVHLEAVSDYSTEGFIATYRRFTARRGIAHTLYSDCGTNFVGADGALRRMFTQSSQEHKVISSVLSKDNSQWKFNPPATPHMGGKWEAVVKSVKFHLRRTVGEILLTFEEFSTLLSQIEAILNSRPIEPLTDDPEDVSALTPGHFLIGTALTTLPEPSLPDLASSQLAHWKLIQQRVQSFWAQWSAHYLQRLQSISKWHHSSNIIKVGSLVLLTDERFPPCKWPLARVLKLHPGQDGLTRVVTLKTATTTLTRPLTKLAPLPTPQPVHQDTTHQGITQQDTTHQQPLLMAGGMLENDR